MADNAEVLQALSDERKKQLEPEPAPVADPPAPAPKARAPKSETTPEK